jgi:uncharacterized RDD family membrane protein YckC
LFIAGNSRKRALHDFIAGSFVITKRSYDATNAAAAEDPPLRLG